MFNDCYNIFCCCWIYWLYMWFVRFKKVNYLYVCLSCSPARPKLDDIEGRWEVYEEYPVVYIGIITITTITMLKINSNCNYNNNYKIINKILCTLSLKGSANNSLVWMHRLITIGNLDWDVIYNWYSCLKVSDRFCTVKINHVSHIIVGVLTFDQHGAPYNCGDHAVAAHVSYHSYVTKCIFWILLFKLYLMHTCYGLYYPQ